MLSTAELTRYARHFALPSFGREGQERLKESRVLVVGAGGLGCPLLQYLTAAGVGTIGLIDPDVVDETNLQRQVLYTVDNVGRPKVEAAAARLRSLNPYVRFETYQQRLTSENALALLARYDVVADGTDNFATRYLVNDACVLARKPNVYGSVFRFEGQVSVFNYARADGTRGPDYRDLFPKPPPAGLVPNCAEGGILGVLPGIIGSLQASEVIKVLTGIGEPLVGRLFVFDAATFQARTVRFGKDTTRPPVTELIDYDYFCGHQPPPTMQEITVQKLNEWREADEDFQLIDVREPFEYDIANLDGVLMPMKTVPDRLDEIARDRPVVIHCRSGGRSGQVVQQLTSQHGFDNLYNLKGGILAWADEIDPSVPKY